MKGKAILCAALLLAGCSSSAAPANKGEPLIETPLGQLLGRPTQIDFSVDGDLEMANIQWSFWSASAAFGTGTVTWRTSTGYASGQGDVLMGKPRVCKGISYYTFAGVIAHGMPRSDGAHIRLSTLCDS